jgi:hypothetical protein
MSSSVETNADHLPRRMAVVVFLAFALAYFFSALVRAITATLSPTLTTEFSLSAQDLGLLAGGYFLGFSLTQLPFDLAVVAAILEALALGSSPKAYATLTAAWARDTAAQQVGRGRQRRFLQLIIRVTDDRGAAVSEFDLILLAGPRYDPEAFPKGFVIDKQVNRRSPQTITFYLDYDAVCTTRAARFGFRILARPTAGFAWYEPVEFRFGDAPAGHLLAPNLTCYIDVTLRRRVDRQAARLDPASAGPRDFRGQRPEGTAVP